MVGIEIQTGTRIKIGPTSIGLYYLTETFPLSWDLMGLVPLVGFCGETRAISPSRDSSAAAMNEIESTRSNLCNRSFEQGPRPLDSLQILSG